MQTKYPKVSEKLNSDCCRKIIEFLPKFDFIALLLKDLNKEFRKYFNNNIEIFKIYHFINRYKKTTNKSRDNKIRVLNIMGDSQTVRKFALTFKVSDEQICKICREIAYMYNDFEFKKFN